jgi:hypothetical protein
MSSRTWIKLYCENWLTGTLRTETPEVRSVWADLLALVGNNKYSDYGRLQLSPDIGYSDQQIVKILKIPLRLWVEAKQRFIATDRITVDDDNIISIQNWSKYQVDYTRQIKYKKSKAKNILPP